MCSGELCMHLNELDGEKRYILTVLCQLHTDFDSIGKLHEAGPLLTTLMGIVCGNDATVMTSAAEH